MGQEAVAAAQPPAAPGAAAPLAEQGFAWLETLWATIDSRADADPAASYTARLLAAGVDGPSRKVAEEATEVLMAAKDDAVAAGESRPATRDALAGEVADLLYHTLVLLRERGLPPGAVIARLRERHKA
jgi:phosphoribosyl-ATP pyrophosphohydrolase